MVSSLLPKLLLIGADGQVGWELARALAPIGHVISASIQGHRGLSVDLTDFASIRQLINNTRPDFIINAAAYTAVDQAEREPEIAMTINGDALRIIAELAGTLAIPVVHYSTDFVFSGNTDRPYREEDAPQPINVYGATKRAGEQALLDSQVTALILRTAWVYGARGKNFLLTMLKLFRERENLQVVNDQIGTPTWSRLLAQVTALIIYRASQGEIDLNHVKGLYHVTNTGMTSWFGFATAIQKLVNSPCQIQAITSAEYPTVAQRPAYSVLDTQKLTTTFGLVLPDWHDALILCLEELNSS
jgi:dTDP-4-dehydrorhamnose reductase